MKALFKVDSEGIPYNVDTFSAYQGFKELGFECLFFNKYEDLIDVDHKQEEPIVGDFEILKQRLHEFNIEYKRIDFPAEIGEFIGRLMFSTNIQTIKKNPKFLPLFIKSLGDKRLPGKVFLNSNDVDSHINDSDNFEVLCSYPVNFTSEWRVFIRHGEVLDVRPYKGDRKVHCNHQIIKDAVQTYTSAPSAYSLDFGVTDENETLLININEGCTSECYGLNPEVYARFLLTRWEELSKTSHFSISQNI